MASRCPCCSWKWLSGWTASVDINHGDIFPFQGVTTWKYHPSTHTWTYLVVQTNPNNVPIVPEFNAYGQKILYPPNKCMTEETLKHCKVIQSGFCGIYKPLDQYAYGTFNIYYTKDILFHNVSTVEINMLCTYQSPGYGYGFFSISSTNYGETIIIGWVPSNNNWNTATISFQIPTTVTKLTIRRMCTEVDSGYFLTEIFGLKINGKCIDKI